MFKGLLTKFEDFIEKNKYAGITVAVVSAILIILFSLSKPYELLELTMYDMRFKLKPAVTQWEYLTFLNMDDSSLQNIGKFPWPRHIYTNGLQLLKEMDTKMVAFDVEFPDESEDKVNEHALEKIYKLINAKKKISKEEINELVISADKILAEGFKLSDTIILPFHFLPLKKDLTDITQEKMKELKIAQKIFYKKASIKVPEDKKAEFESLVVPDMKSISHPIPRFIKHATSFGYVDSDFDDDGISRKIRLVRVFNGRLFFHLSMVMLMDICKFDKKDAIIIPGDKILLKSAFNPVTHEIENIEIPIDDNGMIQINWAGTFAESFNHISFYALLEYPIIRDDVYDFFDDLEQDEISKTGNSARGKLNEQLDASYARYNSTRDLSIKKEEWKKINILKSKINDIEQNYADKLEKAIEITEKELKTNDNKAQKAKLEYQQQFLKAIKIVTKVENMRNQAALIGLTATASHDLGPTPLANKEPMVATYHNILNSILNNAYITRASIWINILLFLIFSFSISFFVQRLNARYSIVVIFTSLILINILNILTFALASFWVDQLGMTLSLVLPSAVIVGVKFIREESQRKFIKNAFSHYLSPGVIDQIIDDPESLKLGGESRNMTMFFSDVQSFSTISEKLTPTELVELLNEYLSEMSDIIMEYEGTVDKYEGDGIMAFYGAPHHVEDHEIKACLSSIEMQERLSDMRKVWKKQKRSELYVRVGLNSGEANVGNMGSRNRMDYTVMGDAVNLAARLESANKFYKTFSMISNSTYQKAKDHIEARQLDKIRVMGKEEPITVFEILGRKGQISDKVAELLTYYNEGLDLFNERQWKKASKSFKAALKVDKLDGPSAKYLDRCTEYSRKGPSKNWDGVYRLTAK